MGSGRLPSLYRRLWARAALSERNPSSNRELTWFPITIGNLNRLDPSWFSLLAASGAMFVNTTLVT